MIIVGKSMLIKRERERGRGASPQAYTRKKKRKKKEEKNPALLSQTGNKPKFPSTRRPSRPLLPGPSNFSEVNRAKHNFLPISKHQRTAF